MASEVFVNVGESTLAVAALSTDTTLTLLSGAPFPAAGQYRIRLDDSLQKPGGIATRYEINRATFNAGNVINSFSTGADLEGTTSQGWPIGTAVRAIVTAAALRTYTSGGPYKARAYRNAAQVLPAGWSRVALDSITYDPNSNMSNPSGGYLYNCPVAGYYQVNGRVGIAAANIRTVVAIDKNGVEYSRGGDSQSAGSAMGVSVNDVIPCAAGDTLALWISAGVVALDFGASITYLSVHYLSS